MMTRIWARTLGATIAIVALIIATNPAQAAFTLYTDRATFNAATTTTTIDFEQNTSGNFTYYDNPGLTIGRVDFRGIVDGGGSDYLYTVDPDISPSLFEWGSGDVLHGPTGNNGFIPGQILVTLTPGFTAVGVDLMTIFGYAGTIDIGVSTGDVTSIVTLNDPNRQFLGFTSDVAITSVSYRARGTSFVEMDNFSYGSANDVNPTPAPAGIVLFGLGFAGLGMFRSVRKGKIS